MSRPGPARPSTSGAAGPAKVSRSEWKRPSKARVRRIRDRLRQMYGRPMNLPHRQPVDELVRTVLSQATSDLNRDRAFGRLNERFDSWEAVRDAPVADVEEAIRPGGLSRQKAPRIQAVLRELGPGLDLDWIWSFLKRMGGSSTPQTRTMLENRSSL